MKMGKGAAATIAPRIARGLGAAWHNSARRVSHHEGTAQRMSEDLGWNESCYSGGDESLCVAATAIDRCLRR